MFAASDHLSLNLIGKIKSVRFRTKVKNQSFSGVNYLIALGKFGLKLDCSD